MIPGLCGFADLLRRQGGDVGSTELIDAARALALTDLAVREDVRRALHLTIAPSSLQPEVFDRLFDQWFCGAELDLDAIAAPPPETDGDQPALGLDADTVEATRIHADDAVAIEADRDPDAEGAEGTEGASGQDQSSAGPSAPATPTADGVPVAATGDLASVPPRDDDIANDSRDGPAIVDLPTAPLAAELELARDALADAIERRRRAAAISTPRRVTTLSQPLSVDERTLLTRAVRRLDRELEGAPSWRRGPRRRGTIDLRRTMRRSVTTGGLPIEVRHAGRRPNAALLVVLVDLSLSVRGTARLVLHLVHRMRSMLGSLRAFGFVDSCVPIDRALRVADSEVAIERVLGLVDVDATSDPGLAVRRWWARSHHLVTPETHVMILGDGRCNGRDPAFDVVDRISRRSASTLWVSPEPSGAWTLGRGEMATYAQLVDRAITVRSIDDLDQLRATR